MLPRAFQWCGTTASFPAGMVPASGGQWGGGGQIWVSAPGWRKSAPVPFCRHLARRVQVGCPVVAVLQDALALSSTGAEPQPLFPKQLLDWEEDAQLCSWFLDRKVRRGTWR